MNPTIEVKRKFVTHESKFQLYYCHRDMVNFKSPDWTVRVKSFKASKQRIDLVMVEKAIKRFSIRFRMEDDTGTAIFEAPDFEVQKILRFRAADLICLEEEHGKHAVEEALLTFFTVEIDYGPTIHKFNMNQNVKEIYTVTRMTYTQNTTTDFEI